MRTAQVRQSRRPISCNQCDIMTCGLCTLGNIDQIFCLTAFREKYAKARGVFPPHHIRRGSIIGKKSERSQSSHKIRRGYGRKAKSYDKDTVILMFQKQFDKHIYGRLIHRIKNTGQFNTFCRFLFLVNRMSQRIDHITITLIAKFLCQLYYRSCRDISLTCYHPDINLCISLFDCIQYTGQDFMLCFI